MLEIKIIKNGTYFTLDLYPDTKLNLSLNSPIWEFNEIIGSYSLPFEIPATNNNLQSFDFVNINGSGFQTYKSEIWVNKLLLYEGTIEISETYDKKIVGTLYFNISRLFEIKDKKLSELDIFGGDKNWIWLIEYLPELNGFALPEIENLDFLKDTLFSTKHKNINKFDNDIDLYYAQYAQNVPEAFFYPVIPMPSLQFTLYQIFKYFGFEIIDDFFLINNNHRLITINVNDINKVKYDSNTDKFEQFVDTYNLKNNMPGITVAEFFKSISNYFCLNFNIINNKVTITPIKNYISDNNFIDLTEKTSKSIKKIAIQKIEGINIIWAENEDLLSKIPQSQNSTNKDVLFDAQFPPYNYPNPDEIEANTINIIPNSSETVFTIANYIEFSGEIVLRWHNFSMYSNFAYNQFYVHLGQNYFKNIFNSDNFLDVNLNIVPYTTPTEPYAYVPKIIQPGNSMLKKGQLADQKLRLAYFIRKAGSPTNKPYLSHILNTKQLDLWSPNGIFETYWKEVFDYLKTIEYEIETSILLTFRDLLFFDFSKKYKIENELFFCKSIHFSIDINGNISETNAVFMPTFYQ